MLPAITETGGNEGEPCRYLGRAAQAEEEPVQRPWGRRANVAQDSAEEKDIRTESWRRTRVGEVGAGLVWI